VGQALPVGFVLNGEYRIDSLLGEGGFGKTYLAFELGLDRHVALKEFFPTELAMRSPSASVVPSQPARAEDFSKWQDRFASEARLLARFKHANIVRVFRTFVANNTSYMVLAFVQGSDMERWLKSRSEPPDQATLDGLLDALTDGLAVVHAAGILHRDIKPANILIRESDGQPVLIDFGAARVHFGETSATATAIVTRGYAPQEAYSRERRLQGPWTDIYGLAATVYRALDGRAPADAIARALDDTLMPATRLPFAGRYRPEFLAAVDWGLTLEPGKRPQTVAEWRARLLPPPRPSKPKPSVVATRSGSGSATGRPEAGATARTAGSRAATASAVGPSRPKSAAATLTAADTRLAPSERGDPATAFNGAAYEPAPVAAGSAAARRAPPSPAIRQPPLLVAGALGLLALGGGVLAWSLLSAPSTPERPPPPPAPVVATPAPSRAPPAEPRPAPAPEQPAAAPPPAALPPRVPPPDRLAAIAAESNRERLLQIAAENPVLREAVERRLAAIGYTRVQARLGEHWLKAGGGEAFRDCPKCPEMVLLPPGALSLGSPAGEPGRNEDEDDRAGPGGGPVSANLPLGFAVGRFEVTRAEWAEFIAATGYRMAEGCYARYAGWQLIPENSWRSPGFSQSDRDPVACVNHADASAYVAWLAERTGLGYRLLTEVEWEYAARGGSRSRFGFGDREQELCSHGNVADRAAQAMFPEWVVAPCRDEAVNTIRVGAYRPNGFGLYDMHGNVWEWVDDCYHASYATMPSGVRDAGRAWSERCEPADSGLARGGSWSDPPARVRAAARLPVPRSVRDEILGFRIARTL
jgi:formylglycine-generating enzyme required for sulfatase activity/serine/threonine protein kinase